MSIYRPRAAVVLRRNHALLFLHESPNLIDLNAATGKVAHLVAHDRGAAGPHFAEKAHDCVPVHSGHALG